MTRGGSTQHSAKSATQQFTCGALAGLSHVVVFNPWDRALFLANFHARPFLHPQNFVRPYEGFHQAFIQRFVSIGLYFPLSDISNSILTNPAIVGSFALSPSTASIVSGMMAGSLNAIVTNPMSLVKYQSWGTHHKGRIFRAGLEVLNKGGPAAFMRGLGPTLGRDMVWGGVYNILREHTLPAIFSRYNPQPQSPHQKKRSAFALSFAINSIAATMATIVSSPWNFLRNIHYGSNPALPISSRDLLRQLWKDMQKAPEGALLHFQRRLSIGWGTLRVGVGMGFASQVYEFCVNHVPANIHADPSENQKLN